MRHPLGFSAASVAVVLGCLAIGSLLAGPAPSAYAQLVEPLLRAKSGQFVLIAMNGEKEVGRGRGYFDGPMSRIDTPSRAGRAHTVYDGVNGLVLSISEPTKTARLSRLPFFERDRRAAPELMNKFGGGMLGTFRMYLDDGCDLKSFGEGVSRQSIEEEGPDGVVTSGVRLTTPGMTQTLWADPQTGEPDRIEIEIKRLAGFKTVLTDFRFGVEVDPALLSMEPPEGYAFQDASAEEPPAKPGP